MRVLIAPDKFKGSLTAAEVAAAVAAGLTRRSRRRRGGHAAGRRRWRRHGRRRGLGRASSAIAVDVGRADRRAGRGVVRRCVTAWRWSSWPTWSGSTGCPVAGSTRSASSTYGLGLVIRDAIEQRRRPRSCIGLGGSASTDGGAGHGAGARRRGRSTPTATRSGAAGARSPTSSTVDVSELREVGRVDPVRGGQRRRQPAARAARRGRGLRAAEGRRHRRRRRCSRRRSTTLGRRRVATLTGADRVRGRRAPARPAAPRSPPSRCCGAELRPGIELMLDLVGFHEALPGVDLVITGEGSLDEQSLAGKAPMGVSRRRRGRPASPVVAVCGRCLLSRRAAGGGRDLSRVPAVRPGARRRDAAWPTPRPS